jgi:hypothetical protein
MKQSERHTQTEAQHPVRLINDFGGNMLPIGGDHHTATAFDTFPNADFSNIEEPGKPRTKSYNSLLNQHAESGLGGSPE